MPKAQDFCLTMHCLPKVIFAKQFFVVKLHRNCDSLRSSNELFKTELETAVDARLNLMISNNTLFGSIKTVLRMN